MRVLSWLLQVRVDTKKKLDEVEVYNKVPMTSRTATYKKESKGAFENGDYLLVVPEI